MPPQEIDRRPLRRPITTRGGVAGCPREGGGGKKGGRNKLGRSAPVRTPRTRLSDHSDDQVHCRCEARGSPWESIFTPVALGARRGHHEGPRTNPPSKTPTRSTETRSPLSRKPMNVMMLGKEPSAKVAGSCLLRHSATWIPCPAAPLGVQASREDPDESRRQFAPHHPVTLRRSRAHRCRLQAPRKPEPRGTGWGERREEQHAYQNSISRTMAPSPWVGALRVAAALGSEEEMGRQRRDKMHKRQKTGETTKLGSRMIAPLPRAAAVCFAAIFEPEEDLKKRGGRGRGGRKEMKERKERKETRG